MKATTTILFILTTTICFSQPNKYLTDAFLRNDSFYIVKGDVILFRGKVTGNSGAQTINYLPEKGNYLSKTSGNALGQIGYWNLAIGDNAFDSSNSPNTSYNICFGKDAGKSLNGAQDNFFAGWDAGYNTKGGSANIGIVEDALFSNIGGRDNIAMGRGSQYSHPSPISNVNIGYNTSYYQIRGTENTGIGSYTLGFMEGGYGVTAVGAYAGEMNGAGAGKTIFNSTFIGYSAGLNSMFSNSICFGANTEVTADRQMNIANTIYTDNLGLSNARTKIKGSLEVTTGDITFNGVQYHLPATYPLGVQTVLVNDGNGNLSWQATTTTAKSIQPQTFILYDNAGRMFYAKSLNK